MIKFAVIRAALLPLFTSPHMFKWRLSINVWLSSPS